MGREHLRAHGKNSSPAIKLREGLEGTQNPESSRILELNKALAVIMSNPLAKVPTS